MASETITLFAYGTLQDPEIQQILFGSAIRMQAATLTDWQLYADQDGYFFIKQAKGSVVTGHIIRLTPTQLWIADQWEEVPSYTRILVFVHMDNGDRCESWVYVKDKENGKPVEKNTFAELPRAEIIAAAKKLKAELNVDKRNGVSVRYV